jgi:hypothetical protein
MSKTKVKGRFLVVRKKDEWLSLFYALTAPRARARARAALVEKQVFTSKSKFSRRVLLTIFSI